MEGRRESVRSRTRSKRAKANKHRKGKRTVVSKEDPDIKHQNKHSTTQTNVVAHARGKSRASIQSAGGAEESQASLATEPIDWEHIGELIEQLPEIDATKVVRLHNQIITEEYKIDTKKIAKKIIETELMLYR